MDLSEIRDKLDELDRKLVGIVAQRQRLIPEVAEYKKKNNIERYQPEREKEIIKSKRNLAENENVDPDLIEGLFKRIIKNSHKIEKEIMGE